MSGICVALAVLVASCSSSSGDSTEPGQTPSSATEPPAVLQTGTTESTQSTDPTDRPIVVEPQVADNLGGGRFALQFEHPSWGSVELVTYEDSDGTAGFDVTDATGQLVFSYVAPMSMFYFEPNGYWEEPGVAIDAAGNIFIQYDAGFMAHFVLRPASGGFDYFGTEPDPDNGIGHVEIWEAGDRDGDGVFELMNSVNDCVPDCTMGTMTYTQYSWTGSDFAP